MKSNNKILRGFSLFLTAVIVFLSLHITASAEMTVHIKSFNSLGVTEYTFDEGTDEQTVIDSLPKTITAQVDITTYVKGDTTADSSYSTDDNYQISVGWISHDYGTEPGEYTFMGYWAGKGYTYSSNLAYPTVTVKVVAKTVEKPEDKPEVNPEVNPKEEPTVKPDTKPDSTPTPNPAPTTGETTTPTVEDNKTRTPSQLPINPDTTTDNKKSEETTAPVDNKDKEVKDNKEDNTKKPSSDSSSSNTESNKSNSNNKSS
ncbi:MAG: hypothetical protein K5883_06840, partial [Pseudobutyrivibrio sp.]|nr:hypothetical protein [Pseudobutyrivibrio sp.]